MSLLEWLALLAEDRDDGGRPVVDFAFPNEKLRHEYLDSIAARTDEEVRDLLRRFLIKTGEFGSDELRAEWLKHLFFNDQDGWRNAMTIEYYRRLSGLDESGEPTWQGLTWILDLLPRWPMKAIEVLESFLLAHLAELPDGRIWGIGDAQALIRTMWIGNPTSGAAKRNLIFQLGPRRFEYLVESLYHAMGFATHLTAQSMDGGRDVEIVREAPGARERSLVECKLWLGRVGVPKVRQLLGAVAHENWTKGILVAPSGFTKPARTMAQHEPRIELMGWEALLSLLDQHLGAQWGQSVDQIITDSLKRADSTDQSVASD